MPAGIALRTEETGETAMDDGEAGGGGRPARAGTALRTSWRLWNFKAPEWRTAAWLGALLVAGLILLLTAHPAAPPKTAAAGSVPLRAPGSAAGAPLQGTEQAIEANLAQALDAIAGAGPVTVRVHLAEGPVTEFAANTQETDSTSSQTGQGSGGQVTTQRSVSRQLAGAVSGGGAVPVRSVRAPQISGVLVVAVGAVNPAIRAELAAAVHAATGVALYQVVVLPATAGGSTRA